MELARALGFHDPLVEDQLILGALLARVDVQPVLDRALAAGWRERLEANSGRLMRCLHLARYGRQVGLAEPWDDPEGAVVVAAWNLSDAGVRPKGLEPLIVRTPW